MPKAQLVALTKNERQRMNGPAAFRKDGIAWDGFLVGCEH